MRIDIGPEGRIVGTKRVNAGGQVAGLAGLAGKDVLILVPGGRPSFSFAPGDYIHEWQQFARRSTKRAAKELLDLRKRIPSRHEVLRRARKELSTKALKSRLPAAAQARRLLEKRVLALRRRKDVRGAEKWVKARWSRVEARFRPAAA